MTLTPAYGRDYKSRKAVEVDFFADRDFIIADMTHPYEGKPVNRSQLAEEGLAQVNVRYAQLRKIAVLKVSP